MSNDNGKPFFERAYDDWLARYYDDWYPPTDDAYQLLVRLIETLPELQGKSRPEIELWDCACGTGATFIPLMKAGYRPWGSDGSAAMLEKAREKCMRDGLPTAPLIEEPLSWNDAPRCRGTFERQRFDIIFALNNSLCHMPQAEGYLDVALANFFHLLKPGGRLIVDTKRYLEALPIDRVAMHHEMRWLEGAWRLREERCDTRIIGGVETKFHTELFYDVDSAFQRCRARIEVTIESEGDPQIHSLNYYPLPAKDLAAALSRAGFIAELFEARTPPWAWGYDCFVAQRPS